VASKGLQKLLRSRLAIGYLLILPALLIILFVNLYPIVLSIWYSLQSGSFGTFQYVGLANYRELFLDPNSWGSMSNTIRFAIPSVILQISLGMAIALFVRRSSRVSGIVRTAAIVPWTMGLFVTGLLWRYMFSTAFGVINVILLNIGLIKAPVDWLTNHAMASVIGVEVWRHLPFAFILLLAGLQTIPPELYEVAHVEGGRPWAVFWRVTLPMVKPVVLVVLLFQSIDALRAYAQVLALTRGGPGVETQLVSLYLYNQMFSYMKFGFASAGVLTLAVISLIISFFYVRTIFKASDI